MYGELMSRIGKKPVVIPSGVKVEHSGRRIKVSGPGGSLEMDCHPKIKVVVDGKANVIQVINDKPDVRQNRQLHGTMRALIANMVRGAAKSFERKMEIYGTGYSVKEQSGKVVLTVGFAHPVEMPIPKAVKVKVEVPATKGNETPAKFTLSSADKCELGRFAADIRKVRPPEPYQGKGIRYADEHVKRKVGKTFTSGTA